MSVVENTCRTCGKTSEQEDGSDLYPMYTSAEYSTELNMIQEEFEIWNLNISQGDGLPQKICLTCFDSFCQIHNFRIICQEAQLNFGELCTGLDIIIKFEHEHHDADVDFPEDYEGEQTITVQEHYQFPGDERAKQPDSEEINETLETQNSVENELTINDPNADADDIDDPMPQFKQYQCEFCLDVVSFDDPDMLNDHYNVHHSTDLPYPCPKCDKRFSCKAKRNSHSRIHFPIIVECEICSKKIRGGKQMMAQHHEFHHIEKSRECTVCGKKFEKITLKRFNYHMSWHDDTKLHKCKFCDKKFIQINHLVAHERTHTASKNHIRNQSSTELQCPHCPKKFIYKHSYKIHLKVHDPNRKLSRCDVCEKEFRSAMNLRLHNYKWHDGPATPAILNVLKKRQTKQSFIKPFKCTQCVQSYVLHTQLINHMKKHEEDRPYTCDTCGKTFKREAHLKLHINSLHLNKKPHKCDLCGWAFSQRNNLREHHAAKHEDKKDFKCDVCGKEFAIAKTLKTHKLKHLDRKPFACTICHKSFRQLGVLKIHINSHLKKNEADVEGAEITDIVL